MNTETAAKIIAKMAFSAMDYIRDREQIIQEAADLYTRQTGEDPACIQTDITDLVERSFAERKILSIQSVRLPGRFKDGSRFGISLNNIEVKGIVYLSPKEITVEITEPFQGKRAGAMLNLLAPVIWTELPEAGSEANETGRKKAITLLTDIYYSYFLK